MWIQENDKCAMRNRRAQTFLLFALRDCGVVFHFAVFVVCFGIVTTDFCTVGPVMFHRGCHVNGRVKNREHRAFSVASRSVPCVQNIASFLEILTYMASRNEFCTQSYKD